METDELGQYLDALKREECYRVDAVLKQSAHEVTQRVTFVGSNGAEQGPFVRKYIKRDAGMGGAYERIREAQAAGKRFKHLPAIMECYTSGEDLVVVMECVRGETLQDYVYRNDPSVELAKHIFPPLCDAVAELHDEFRPPIIHRDLKPSNIILSEGGLTLIDFGISRDFKDGAVADTHHFGTREFAPPEQFGFGQTSVRSDVYALGMLLCFCLTEVIPTAALREGGFADLRIPEALRQVIVKATALDPSMRFASAAELKGAFLHAAGCAIGGAGMQPGMQAGMGFEQQRPQEERPAGQGARMSTLSIVRNSAVAALTALFLLADWWGIVKPPESNADKPLWYNLLTFALFGTSFIVACGYTLLDRKALSAYSPLFNRVKPWHLWVACAVILLVGAAITAAVYPTAA